MKAKHEPHGPVQDQTAGQTAAVEDVEAVMKKYDRESNVRVWEGTPKIVVRCIMALFSVYCIYMTLFSTAIQEVRLSAFLALIVLMGYLTYPAKKGVVRVNHIPWYDIILMVVGTACFLYFTFNAMTIIKMSVKIGTLQVVVGIVGILILMVIEGIILGRKVNRLVREKYPDTTLGKFGLGMYAFGRATMIRKMRNPAPQVEIGEDVR